MKKLLAFIFCFIAITCNAQDIVFVHDEPQPLYLDTSIRLIDTSIGSFLVYHNVVTGQNGTVFKQPIVFDQTTIDSLYVDWVDFQSLIIENCKLKKSVTVSRAYANITIRNSTFNSKIKVDGGALRSFFFINNKVYDTCIFVQLNDQAKLDSNLFFGHVQFLNCNFQSLCLRNNFFSKKVDFINTGFTDCNFENVAIFDNINLGSCKFLGSTSFKSNTFGHTFDLSKSAFSGKVNFDSCVFVNKLRLDSIIIDGGVDFSFNGTVLPDTLDLTNNPLLSNIIDLTNVHWVSNTKRCIIYLHKTDVSKVKLEYQHFKLAFSIEVSKAEKELIYETLLKDFKNHSQNESYELLDIEYQDFKHGFFKWQHWWNCYGYRKEWIFRWTFVLLSAFTIITFFVIHKLTKFVYRIEHIPNLPSLRQTWAFKFRFRHLRRRLWYSFVYTAAIFFLLLLKVEKIKFKNYRGVIYLMFVYAFGIICIAYMANFILQK